jgi:hypothetical protein
MRNDLAFDSFRERYVVEVDGIAKAEYPIFVCALKASLQLKQELPNSRVKLRDWTATGRRIRALTYIVVAKGLQVDRYLLRRWPIRGQL